jgi:hypothetical protein
MTQVSMDNPNTKITVRFMPAETISIPVQTCLPSAVRIGPYNHAAAFSVGMGNPDGFTLALWNRAGCGRGIDASAIPPYLNGSQAE